MTMKNSDRELRKIEGVNIEEEVKLYRRYIETAQDVQKYAERVFDTVKDMSLVEKLTRDPYLVAIQPDEELKRDASLLYAAASAMDHMEWHFELHFEEYEVHVMVMGYTPF